MEVHYAELSITRTAVLDYFQSEEQKRLAKIFSFEEHYKLHPGKELVKYLRAIGREVASQVSAVQTELLDGLPESSLLLRNYPELRCFRDIVFTWKWFLNPQRSHFPNYVKVGNDTGAETRPRKSVEKAQMVWSYDPDERGFKVRSQSTQRAFANRRLGRLRIDAWGSCFWSGIRWPRWAWLYAAVQTRTRPIRSLALRSIRVTYHCTGIHRSPRRRSICLPLLSKRKTTSSTAQRSPTSRRTSAR